MRVVLFLRFVVNDGVAIRAVPGTTAHTAGWMGSMIGVLVVFDLRCLSLRGDTWRLLELVAAIQPRFGSPTVPHPAERD